jgi:hypothetical protein
MNILKEIKRSFRPYLKSNLNLESTVFKNIKYWEYKYCVKLDLSLEYKDGTKVNFNSEQIIDLIRKYAREHNYDVIFEERSFTVNQRICCGSIILLPTQYHLLYKRLREDIDVFFDFYSNQHIEDDFDIEGNIEYKYFDIDDLIKYKNYDYYPHIIIRFEYRFNKEMLNNFLDLYKTHLYNNVTHESIKIVNEFISINQIVIVMDFNKI